MVPEKVAGEPAIQARALRHLTCTFVAGGSRHPLASPASFGAILGFSEEFLNEISRSRSEFDYFSFS